MNIKVDVDITPEELRRLMGLPDMQEFNRAIMDEMLNRMRMGVEGYDPTAFFKPAMFGGTDTMKRWMDMFGNFALKPTTQTSSSGEKTD